MKRTRIKTIRFHLVWGFLCALFFFSCVSTSRHPPNEAISLLTVLDSSKYLPDHIKGKGKLTVSGRSWSQSMRIAWIVERPGRLRFQATGPLGQPLFMFILKDGIFYFRSAQEEVFYTGKGTSENLKTLLFLPIKGEYLMSVFSGRPPIPSFQRAAQKQSIEPRYNMLILQKKRDQTVGKIWFNDAGTVAEKAALFDGWGNLQYTVKFGSFKKVDGKIFPHDINVIVNDGQGQFTLQAEKIWTGFEVQKHTFTPDLRNARVVDLDA